jgi:hypothetical protein
MKTFEDFNKWYASSNIGETTNYYEGFFVKDAEKNFEMRKFSKNLMDFESKTRAIVLFQKKVKDMVFKYYVKKIK